MLDERGGAVHRRGVTDSPGLYFLGLTWQYTRGSALIGWVKDDAEFIAENVKTFEASALALEETGRADRAELAHVPASREE